MATPTTPVSGTIPQPKVSSRSGNRSHEPGRVFRRHASIARAIGQAILLVLASVTSVWLVNNGQDELPVILAQDASTPSDASTHPIAGAWESPNGIPCWCLSIFTADGLAIGLDPTYEDSTSGMSSQPIAMGFWEPTGDRTAIGVVRIPMDDGGHIERSIHWTVSEDGRTATGSGTQRAINEDGDVFTMGGSPPIEMVRMSAPETTPVATPTD